MRAPQVSCVPSAGRGRGPGRRCAHRPANNLDRRNDTPGANDCHSGTVHAQWCGGDHTQWPPAAPPPGRAPPRNDHRSLLQVAVGAPTAEGNTLRTTPVGSTTMLFVEPPLTAAASYQDQDYYQEPPSHGPAGLGAAQATALRMMRGAREAATGMGISDDKILALIENPEDIGPDERDPARMCLRGGGLEVIMGADGMILRVLRRR